MLLYEIMGLLHLNKDKDIGIFSHLSQCMVKAWLVILTLVFVQQQKKTHLFITTRPLVWILYSTVRERIIYFFVNSLWKLVEVYTYHSLKHDLFRRLYKNQSKKVLYKLQEYRKRKTLMDHWRRTSYEYKVIRLVFVHAMHW